MDECCAYCRFWDARGPYCRRFPMYRVRSRVDWCGEFQPVRPAQPTRLAGPDATYYAEQFLIRTTKES